MSQICVLIVEDDPHIIGLLKPHLSLLYTVYTATSAEMALEEYRRRYLHIRVVLFNLSFSRTDTTSLISQMRAISHVPEIIVYAKTIHIYEAVRGIKDGASSYLFSIHDTKEVLRVVDDTLTRFDMAKKMESMAVKQFQDQFDLQTLLTLRKEWATSLSSATPRVTAQSILQDIDFAIPFIDQTPKPLPKVLVIEDEEAYRALIIEFLGRDYHVIGVGCCADALTIAQAHPDIDIVLLDVFLTDGSGTDLLEDLHRLAPLSQTVVITAFEFVDIAVESIKSGAIEYLNKPFTKKELLDLISQLLLNRYDTVILPKLTAMMISDTMTDADKYKMLDRLLTLRISENRPLYMADILFVFPDLKALELPATLPIPIHVAQRGIESFISQLRLEFLR